MWWRAKLLLSMLGGSTIIMCNFLGFFLFFFCKILQGLRPAAWNQKGLPFRQNLPDPDWSMQENHTPFTMHHPTKTNALPIYMQCTFQQPNLVWSITLASVYSLLVLAIHLLIEHLSCARCPKPMVLPILKSWQCKDHVVSLHKRLEWLMLPTSPWQDRICQ